MADSVEQLYKAQDLQDKLYPITKENAVKDNNNVSLDTKLTSINTSISNKLEAVKINNTALPITDNAVNITIDSAVSETSTNAVQNKVIKSYVDTAKEEVKEDISNSVLENLTSGSSLKLYAQETLADQEFLYRESPTEEDGLAKITDIKGNTLVWNQQMPISSVASYSDAGITANNNNDGSYTINGTATSVNVNYWLLGSYTMSDNVVFTLKKDHKYLTKSVIFFSTQSNTGVLSPSINLAIETWSLFTVNTSDYLSRAIRVANIENGKTYTNYKFYPMIIDLTQMGLDSITSVSEFTSLFSLPYYAYNQGTLLSFMGNGIKTVGFNQWDEEWEVGGINDTTGEKITVNTQIRSVNYLPCFPSTAYYIKSSYSIYVYYYDSDKSFLSRANVGGYDVRNKTVTTPSNAAYMLFKVQKTAGDITYNNDICINISSSRNGEYEPYTSSTLSLPISTYFPNGMKSAGSVYDELADSKAITRLIKTVVDGTNVLASYYGSFQGHQLFYIDLFATTYVSYANMANLLSNLYETATNVTMDDKYIRYQASDNQANIGRIYWNDDSYTSANAMYTALQSNPLEIISLAQSESSLDVDLDLSFNAYEDGTEQLLPVNGSVPSTSPIIADIEYSYDFKAVDRIIGMLNSVAQNETSPSTHNYSVGDYLVYNYQLYKVIASISTGASLTVGTNIQATTIMNELASLS